MDSEQTQQPQAELNPMDSFLIWLNRDNNFKKFVGGLVAILVVGLGYVLFNWYSNNHQVEADTALFSVPNAMRVGRNGEPPSPEALQKVSDQYSGTGAAERADLLAAGAYFSKGQYDKAQAAFEKFLGSYANSPLRGQAAYGVAASLDAAGKADQAITKYQAVEQEYHTENVYPLAALARALILENQNKAEEALKIYNTLEKTPGFEIWRGEVMSRKDKLVSKNPALEAKEAAAAVPAMSAIPQIKAATPAPAATATNSKP